MGDEFRNWLKGALGESSPRLRVPGNLVPVVEAVADETGVPFEIIAGVIQTNYTTGTSGDWGSKITPEVVAGVAADLAAKRGSTTRLSEGRRGGVTAPEDWRDTARKVFGGDRQTWQDRFDSIVYAEDESGKPDRSRPAWIEREPTPFNTEGRNLTREDWQNLLKRGQVTPDQFMQGLVGLGYSAADAGTILSLQGGGAAVQGVDIVDVYAAFEEFTGRTPSEAEAQKYVGRTYDAMRAALLARPESREWREQGPKIAETRRWADSVFARLTGKAPTNAEIMEVVQRGYTPQTLETYLRSRPSGGTTLGVMSDTRALADKYASQFVGRDADAGEINWIITHNVQTPEGIEAFYEQLRTRIETGDPHFAWAVDPRTWRTRRDEMQQEWNRLGLTGDVSPQFVNRAVNEKWDAERVEDEINSLQAPGFAEGVKVGQINRTRAIASKYKAALFPGQDVTKAELELLLAEHPENVRRYYRSLPAQTRTQPGPAPKGDPKIGAGALRGETYTKPEKVNIEAPPLPGGIGG